MLRLPASQLFHAHVLPCVNTAVREMLREVREWKSCYVQRFSWIANPKRSRIFSGASPCPEVSVVLCWRKLPCVAQCHTPFSQESLPSLSSRCRYPRPPNVAVEVTLAVVEEVFTAVAEAVVFMEADFPAAVDITAVASPEAATVAEVIAAAAFRLEATVVAVLAAALMDSKEVADSAEHAAASVACAAEILAIMRGPPKDAVFATRLPDGTPSSADRIQEA